MTTSPLDRRTLLGAALGSIALAAPVAAAPAASAATSTATVTAIYRLARSRVGKTRYRWGGTSLTSGADCSGFTLRCYASKGISLPRTAAQQRAAVRRITQARAIPGDLVFFHGGSTSSSSNVSHVAIYAGRGYVVDASSSKGAVVYRRIWTSKVSFGTKR